jgi:hypothetical protein
MLLCSLLDTTCILQMEVVAKTLRRVAEGKAAAQVEAAEWKRKYELEMEAKEHKHHDVIKGLFYTIKLVVTIVV